jgi:hypothetical protein
VWAEYPDQGPAWTVLYESVRAVKPKNICRSTPGRDVYNDWFEEEAEARRFLTAIQAEAERA